ncbi:hypothetical protein CMI47_22330 [Candidatus Pacearchaeota archaeon]|nr:hypothetical protein [Candidatus Pacearchaeota archaeon]|tara:strand:+ start:3813 stop:4853 length:1041 start_codon:yes stop_codon:yes gene_type:complete
MELTDKEIKRITVIFFFLVLAILAFFLIRPLLISIIAGLVLAYVFLPVQKKVLKNFSNKNLASSITLAIAILIIIIPLWITMPLIIQQIFEIFTYLQNVDLTNIITRFFPTTSEQFTTQVTLTFNNFISKVASGVLNSLVNFFLDLPTFLLNLFVLAFVFFFSLRDGDRLKDFVLSLSPLTKSQEQTIVKQFRDITDSIVYGQILIGLAQGLLAGLGFFIFGVPNALSLTFLAVILSIIPMLGAGFVWVPVNVYLFLTGNNVLGVLFLLYNIFLTSTVDNFLRIYIVSKKSDIPAVFILIGMIGGLFLFGLLGLLLGPLIVAYFITFLKAYKDQELTSLFARAKKE